MEDAVRCDAPPGPRAARGARARRSGCDEPGRRHRPRGSRRDHDRSAVGSRGRGLHLRRGPGRAADHPGDRPSEVPRRRPAGALVDRDGAPQPGSSPEELRPALPGSCGGGLRIARVFAGDGALGACPRRHARHRQPLRLERHPVPDDLRGEPRSEGDALDLVRHRGQRGSDGPDAVRHGHEPGHHAPLRTTRSTPTTSRWGCSSASSSAPSC